MKRMSCGFLTGIVLLILFLFGCRKESNFSLPIVVTIPAPLSIGTSFVVIGIEIKSDGGTRITECGVYMGTSVNPEMPPGVRLTISPSDTGIFSGMVVGLSASTTYYLKAFAKNSKGESLGDQISFTTTGTVKDYDNNTYETVKILNQVWLGANLVTTHYSNGDPVGTTIPPSLDISGSLNPEYQWSYNGDDSYALIYGRLYTWYAVKDTRNICPVGWHVPSDADWTVLETVLGGPSIAGSNLKEVGNDHWISPYNLDATDQSGLTALPGGYRSDTGTFSYVGNYGYWWTSTEGDPADAWARSIYVQSGNLTRSDFTKKNGFSVRCIKN